MKLKRILILTICTILIILLVGCRQKESTLETIVEGISDINEDIVQEDKFVSLNITAIGDIMCHNTQYMAAETKDGYNFKPAFEDVAKYTSKGDVVIANLETVFAGKELQYSNYPTFNTPEQMAQAIKETLKIDIISTNNNHSLDRGFKGLVKTLDFLDSYGIEHVGTYRTEEESKKVLIKNINQAKVAFTSYTYGTNGIKLPEGKEFAVSYIDKNNIMEHSEEAKRQGADIVIVLIHWGNEYQRSPSIEQKELAEWIFKNTNVDIIIGNHPHVIQPIEFINVINKDGEEKEGLVCYALGNFISDQRKRYTDSGIIVDIYLNKNITKDELNINEVTYTPIFTDKNPWSTGKGYRTVNLQKAINDFENDQDKLVSQEEYNKMQQSLKDVRNLIKETERIKINKEF